MNPVLPNNNDHFGYSVKIHASWKVAEKPLRWFDRKPMENTMVFLSEISLTADWVSVEVKPGQGAPDVILRQSALWEITNQIRLVPNVEWKVSEYGKNGYVVQSRRSRPIQGSSNDWAILYYIGYYNRLYAIDFNRENTTEKAYVSTEGYGKVNQLWAWSRC